MKFIIAVSFVLALGACLINADSNADLVNSRVERTIDLNSHLAHINYVITAENKAASGSLKSYTFTVEPAHAKNVAFIGARVSQIKPISTKNYNFN
jgi:hypothetical protein